MVREAGDMQVGRTRRAKRQRGTQLRRLPVLPILDGADLDEAALDIPVRSVVGPAAARLSPLGNMSPPVTGAVLHP